MANKERVYLTAIGISCGIITLITETGEIENYRQRGIGSIAEVKRRALIGLGMLHPNWRNFKELPKNWSISFEDPEIMGRARMSYPDADKILSAVNGRSRGSRK